MSLFEELKRRRVFRLAAAYIVVAWLIVQVVDVIKDPLNLPEWFHTVVIVLLGLMFPIALMLSWAYDVTPDGVVRDDGSAVPAVGIDYGKVALGAVFVLGAFLAGTYLNGIDVGQVTTATRDLAPAIQRFRIDVTSTTDSDPWSFRPNAITPDGRTFVVYARNGGQTYLMSRSLDDFDFTRIDGADNADRVFALSPNGDSVAYYDTADKYIKRIPIAGGQPIPITQVESPLHMLAWGQSGQIVFGTPDHNGLLVVDQSGGEPEFLTEPDADTHHKQAKFIPGTKILVLTIGVPTVTANSSDRIALRLPDGQIRMTGIAGASPAATANGDIVYYSRPALWATTLDALMGDTAQDPVAIAENIAYGGFALYSMSEEGTLIYAPNNWGQENRVVLVDRDGVEKALPLDPGYFIDPMVSPSGDRIALIRRTAYGSDLWLHSIDGTESMKISQGGGLERAPTWTTDESYLYYGAGFPGDVYRLDLANMRTEEFLIDPTTSAQPHSVSPNGQILFTYQVTGSGLGDQSKTDIGIIELTRTAGPSSHQLILDSPAEEIWPSISPDGGWLTYTSDHSGRQEVYVRPFPIRGSNTRTVSIGGGRNSTWSSDGTEIYYLGPTDIMAISIQTEPELRISKPVALFNHERFLYMQGQYYTAQGEFIFSTNPDKHGQFADQIAYIRDWRNLLNDASTIQ